MEGWREAPGYNWRALAEADIGRFEPGIVGEPCWRMPERRAAEGAKPRRARNGIIPVERPDSVRIVGLRTGGQSSVPAGWFVQHRRVA